MSGHGGNFIVVETAIPSAEVEKKDQKDGSNVL